MRHSQLLRFFYKIRPGESWGQEEGQVKTNHTTKLHQSGQPDGLASHADPHTRIVGQGGICFPQSRRVHLPAALPLAT